MARSRRSKQVERDPLEIAIGPMLLPASLPSLVSPLLPSPVLLDEIEDRRLFHPLGDVRPAVAFTGLDGRIGVKPGGVRGARYSPVVRASPTISSTVGFRDPRKVLVCVRRKQRREVMFALRKTKRGAGARRHRRNYHSEVSC